MDPDTALACLREFFGKYLDRAPEHYGPEVHETREAFDALDGWLSGGGFPPADWQTLTGRELVARELRRTRTARNN